MEAIILAAGKGTRLNEITENFQKGMIIREINKLVDGDIKYVAKDEDSYKYLAESIDMHPSQNDLIKIMKNSNFKNCKFNNLSFGVVSIHKGFKI